MCMWDKSGYDFTSGIYNSWEFTIDRKIAVRKKHGVAHYCEWSGSNRTTQ